MNKSIFKFIISVLLAVLLLTVCSYATEEVLTEEILTEDTLIEEIPATDLPIEDNPAEEFLAEEFLAEEILIEDTLIEEILIEEIPAEVLPAEEIPTQELLIEETFSDLSDEEILYPDIIPLDEITEIVLDEITEIVLDEITEIVEEESQELLLAYGNLLYSRDLANGTSGDDVYALQQRLSELGYHVGTIDGQFGPVTEAAVKAFQEDHSLYLDGIVGNITLRELNKDPAGGSTQSTASSSFSDRYLVIGMNGEDVAALQKVLAGLGYNVGTVDGIFGPKTQAAVVAFQKAMGLYPDGEVGSITKKALASFVQPSGQSTDQIPEPLSFTRTLANGMSGADILKLQKCLEALGYSVGGSDGIFGAYTDAAVRAFQKDNNLYVDGVVGNLTVKALNKWINNINQRTDSSASALLKKGMMGSDVLKLQKRLQQLGYSVGTPDGDFGSVTEAAVKAFQRMNGMSSPTGIVDQWTLEKLTGTSVNRYGNTYAIALKTSTGTTTMLRDLSYEAQGEDVLALQQKLVDLGYLIAVPKGYFGNLTYDALVAFQKDRGMAQPTGVADEWTYQQLNKSTAAGTKTVPEYTVSALTTSAYITDKNYDRDDYQIKYIIPHHMAGKMTGAGCANYFVNNGLENSANYCIGYDGDIAVDVPEEYGAWTSSFWAADEQGITIEVSDESRTTDYIPDKAVASLIYLCVDLIQRYPSLGGKMVYDPSDAAIVKEARNTQNPSLLNNVKGNVLLHNWTSGGKTSCPGQDMIDKLPLIATKVNELLANPNKKLDLSDITKITEDKKQKEKEEQERLQKEQEEAENAGNP